MKMIQCLEKMNQIQFHIKIKGLKTYLIFLKKL